MAGSVSDIQFEKQKKKNEKQKNKRNKANDACNCSSSWQLLVLQLLFFFPHQSAFLALTANCSFKAETPAPEWSW